MKASLFFALLFFSMNSFGQKVNSYLVINGNTEYSTITFEKEVYNLAWTHNKGGYYKQEYTRKKDSPEKFNKMITIDVLVSDESVKTLAAAKIKEIEARKGKDPVANYQSYEKSSSGEYMIDFLISEGELYEWNIYRYKTITTNKGKAILLFAYSQRAFAGGEFEPDNFFKDFKKIRMPKINALGTYPVPAINLKN